MSMTIRPVTAGDCDLLFDWVNRSDSLAGKLKTSGPIPREAHNEWFAKRLGDRGTLILVAEDAKGAVGQVRLETKPDAVAEIDIYVEPRGRRQGVATQLLQRAIRDAGAHWGARQLRALVKPDNVASQTLFQRCDFNEVQRDKTQVVFERDAAKGTNSARFAESLALYDRASRTIPLATQTFSKSAMNFVFGASPLFLERGDGAYVWDVDGHRYIDYVLGLLPVVLGYRDPDVDNAIRDQLDRGISFSLATRLEVELAERLVRLIPSAEMVRFGKNGSDATSAAIRLARYVTGRDKVIVGGYHGWHDWYIGSTARDGGVPRAVKDQTVSVPFNDVERIEAQLRENPEQYAALILEPAGVVAPAEGYLQRLRELTERHGILLIFDEIVTGFRIGMGGAQAVYGVTPDLSCFGKAMGNGMPISAVVGPARFMKKMEDIFFSGTFGGEALSLAASIATIDKLERLNGPALIAETGAKLKRTTNALVTRHGLGNVLTVSGPDWWPRMSASAVAGLDATVINSLLRQELVAAGLLMGASFNLCIAHANVEIENETARALDQAFAVFAAHLNSGDPAGKLRGKPIRPVFQVRR